MCAITEPLKFLGLRRVYWAQATRTPPSNLPRPPLPSQCGIEIGSNQEIDVESMCRIDDIVESMPNRPLRRGGRAGFEGGVRRVCAYNKPLQSLGQKGKKLKIARTSLKRKKPRKSPRRQGKAGFVLLFLCFGVDPKLREQRWFPSFSGKGCVPDYFRNVEEKDTSGK